MFSNQDFLQAVDRLRDEWAALVGDENVTALAGWLEETQFDDAGSVQQTAGRVLDLLQAHPEARQRIAGELGIKGALPVRLLGYDALAGAPDEVPAGTVVVCPVDPAHCRKKLRTQGQKLYCPQHGVLLAPENQVEPKE